MRSYATDPVAYSHQGFRLAEEHHGVQEVHEGRDLSVNINIRAPPTTVTNEFRRSLRRHVVVLADGRSVAGSLGTELNSIAPRERESTESDSSEGL